MAATYGGAWPRILPQRSARLTPHCDKAGRAIGAADGDNARMDILLNGDALSLDDTAPTLLALLQQQGLADRRVAVEINGEIVPRGRHAEHRLHDGDRVEIVHALGGG
jgi:sulfur carrier protein